MEIDGGQNNMKRITAGLEYDGLPFSNTMLSQDLKEFHSKHPFHTGMDWEFQLFYAILEDEDCFAFCLKHPQYSDRFKDV